MERNTKLDIVTIPIAVIILSTLASGIWYLLTSLVLFFFQADNFQLPGIGFFLKTMAVFFLIILGAFIYDKEKGRI